MSSIIGHSCAGIIVKNLVKTNISPQKNRVLIGLLIGLSLLPDIDVVFLLLVKSPDAISHRGFTHGLLFIFITAYIFTIMFERYFGISKLIIFCLFSSALLSHIVLDYLMGAGPPVNLFAPFFDKGFLAPIKIVPCAFYPTSIKSIFQIITYPPAIVGYCLEILIFIPIILFLKNQKPLFKIILCAISIFSLTITFLIYNSTL
jgi:inner membrane protein